MIYKLIFDENNVIFCSSVGSYISFTYMDTHVENENS